MTRNPHVMSKYATELECLRARDEWFQEQHKQLVELVRLQHSELVEWCSDIGMDSPAIEAFNKWEGE